jgi:hypothetical protein
MDSNLLRNIPAHLKEEMQYYLNKYPNPLNQPAANPQNLKNEKELICTKVEAEEFEEH